MIKWWHVNQEQRWETRPQNGDRMYVIVYVPLKKNSNVTQIEKHFGQLRKANHANRGFPYAREFDM